MVCIQKGYRSLYKDSLVIGGFKGIAGPHPPWKETFTKKVIFVICRTGPPLSRMVDRSSHERLQHPNPRPFKNFACGCDRRGTYPFVKVTIINNIAAAFQGMHVSPANHSDTE